MRIGDIVKVWRVENKDGVGPYQEPPNWDIQSMVDSHSWEDIFDRSKPNMKTPHPLYDEGINRYPEITEYCGFESISKLHDWFTDDELRILKGSGFKVVRIKGKITAIGKKQVLFERVEACQPKEVSCGLWAEQQDFVMTR